MARPRIVQFIPNLALGGAERMMVSLAQGLHQDGYDVRVLTFFDPTGTQVERSLEASGIELVSLGKTVGFDARMFTRVPAALRRLAPDVLHTHRPVFPYALPTVLNGLSARVVHTVHSVAQKEVAGRARMTSHWLAFCAGVAPVAICDFVARSIVDVYGIPPRATIPNGIPVDDFVVPPGTRERWRSDNGVPAGAVVFASVARLARPKRPDDIVSAFAALRDPDRRAMLLLVGEGSLAPTVAQRAIELGVADRVRCTGARADVPEVLAAADVFVLASDFEGNPLSVMEGMAASKPAVATAVGGVPDLVTPGETGMLVPPRDMAALTAAMQQLLDDAALREEMGRRARQQAEARFDVSLMVSAYERLYDELLQDPLAVSSATPATSAATPAAAAAPRRRRAHHGTRHRDRVVQFIPNLAVGGAERMMVSLAKGLDRDRYDVRVLTFFHGPESRMERELRGSGVEVVSLGKKLGFDARMFTRVAFALRSLQPDILHTHRPVFPYALPSVLGRLRGRVVHTVHNVADREVGDSLRRSTHWLAFHASVAPVAICEFAARTIERTYGTRPRATIPNGIPVQRFVLPATTGAAWRERNGVPADAVVFTSVARLSRQKAPVALIDAFAAAAHDAPNALLIIAGDGELRPAVEGRIRAHGLEPRVRLLGTREDVPEILAASDVFVLPSLFEGHPLSVMEAMAAGVPVLATAVGGVPELVRHGETGLLVPPSDAGALERGIVELSRDTNGRTRMGTLSRHIALKQFDVSHMVAQYDRLYQEILESLPDRVADSARR